jgi:outer membrane murein-binding lipoprotein Lpp
MSNAFLGAVVIPAVLLTGCSSSRDLDASVDLTSTTRKLSDAEIPDDDALVSGSAAVAALQELIDRLLASNDACAILTQRDIKDAQLDPTTLASSAARKTLTKGVIEVYDHVIAIVTDQAVKVPLRVQRDAFVEVLDVVDRYSTNPTSKDANAEITNITRGPEFVAAQSAVQAWQFANCG